MKRWLFSLVAALLMMVALFYWLIAHYDFQFSALLQVSPYFFFVGLLIASLDLSLRGLRLWLVARQVASPIRWTQGVRIALAVDFFAGMTPARIGGEPARVVGLLRAGMPTGKALIVLGIEGLMDLGYLLLAIPLFLWLSSGQDSALVQLIRRAISGGLLLLGLPLALMLLRERYIHVIFGGLRRLTPWLYALISARGKWQPHESIASLRRNVISALRGSKWYLPAGIACTCGWWALRFSALLWISVALGFHLPLADVFWPQFLIYNSMIFTPVPVSGGLFETSFLLLYKNSIPAALLPTAVVLWRFFTFYLFIFAGAVSTTRGMWQLTLQRLEKHRAAKAGAKEEKTA